jgi:hypothetical protein
MNLAILSDTICAQSAEWELVRVIYSGMKFQQTTDLSDSLAYPFIFWNGMSGCGALGDEPIQACILRIGNVSIRLTSRPSGHFIHGLGKLREEILCAVSGRLVNVQGVSYNLVLIIF